MTKEISSQEEFEGIKAKFKVGECRLFSQEFHFNPKCGLKRTDMSVDEALPGKRTQRKNIFEAMASGLAVDLMNQRAKRKSDNAEHDCDIFMALHKGFILLTPPRTVTA